MKKGFYLNFQQNFYTHNRCGTQRTTSISKFTCFESYQFNQCMCRKKKCKQEWRDFEYTKPLNGNSLTHSMDISCVSQSLCRFLSLSFASSRIVAPSPFIAWLSMYDVRYDIHCARRRITEIKFRYQFHVGINLFGWVYQHCRLLVAARTPNDNNNANLWNKYKSNANITKWTLLLLLLLFACACDYTRLQMERFMGAHWNR